MKQLELFPYRDSKQDAINELISRLPITEVNQLIAALHLYENTLLQEMNNEQSKAHND